MTNELSAKAKIPLLEHIFNIKFDERTDSKRIWTIWHGGAVIGLFGGFAAGILGFLMTIIQLIKESYFSFIDLNQAASILLFLTIPLMIFGSFCMDKIESAKKAEKAAACNEYNLLENDPE